MLCQFLCLLMDCIRKYWSLHIHLHVLLLHFRPDLLLLPFWSDLWLLSFSYWPDLVLLSFSFWWPDLLLLSFGPDLLLLCFPFWHHVVLQASPCVYCFLLLPMFTCSSKNVSMKCHHLPVQKHVPSVISLRWINHKLNSFLHSKNSFPDLTVIAKSVL